MDIRQALTYGATDTGDLGWQAAAIIALDGHQGDLLGALVEFGYVHEGPLRARVEWDRAMAPDSLLSDSGRVLAEIAASMSGSGGRHSVDLRFMGCLDLHNGAVVVAAFGHFLQTTPDTRFRR